VRTSRLLTCNQNRFDSLPVYITVRRRQYDRLSQQQLNFLFCLEIIPGQQRHDAHTDHGTISMILQLDHGGLEVY